MVSWRIFEEGYQFVEGANGWGSDVALVVVSCHMRLGGGFACWGYQMRGEGFMKGTTKNQKRYRPVKKKLLGPLFKWCRNVALLDACLLQLVELSLSQMCDLSLTCYSGLF